MHRIPAFRGAAALLAAAACSAPPLELPAVRLDRRDIEVALATNGRVDALGAVAVHAATEGRIVELAVARGDAVVRGQKLLRLADSGQAAARASTRARLAAAQARLAVLEAGLEPGRRAALVAQRAKLVAAREHAARELERLERLVARSAAPRSDANAQRRAIDDWDAEIAAIDAQLAAPPSPEMRRELEAAVQEAAGAVQAADQDLGNLVVRAPRAGTVYALPVAAGGFVDRGGLIARLAEAGKVRVRIFVDEPDLGRVELGQEVRITADAFPGRTWQCAVSQLATEIVGLGPRRIGEICCTLEDPDGLLIPNLAVAAAVVSDRAEQVLSLPRTALRRRAGEAAVWAASDGRAILRRVDVGLEGADFVQIRGGLAASEIALLPGDIQLEPGQKVRVLLGPDGRKE